MRETGILLSLSSLPGGYGAGDMGAEAMAFVDFLSEAGVKVWQLLPLGPTGYGNSPYQPDSSQAGDPMYISLAGLHAEGLLSELPPPPGAGRPGGFRGGRRLRAARAPPPARCRPPASERPRTPSAKVVSSRCLLPRGSAAVYFVFSIRRTRRKIHTATAANPSASALTAQKECFFFSISKPPCALAAPPLTAQRTGRIMKEKIGAARCQRTRTPPPPPKNEVLILYERFYPAV